MASVTLLFWNSEHFLLHYWHPSPERLKEAKEDHDSLHAKLDACIDGIKSISTALASSHTGEKEQKQDMLTVSEQ
jgi:hypothetical protein